MKISVSEKDIEGGNKQRIAAIEEKECKRKRKGQRAD